MPIYDLSSDILRSQEQEIENIFNTEDTIEETMKEYNVETTQVF